jgi:hypothetical protein
MRVRYMAAALLAVFAPLMITGCSVKSALDERLTPEPKTVTVEATVAAVGAAVEGTLTAGFPDTLPLWPGATVVKSKTTKTPQGPSYSAIMTTPDPYADVLAGVGEGLKQAEWKAEALDASTPEQQVTLLTVSRPDADGIVTVTQLPQQPVRIEYVITPKE